MRTHSPHVIWLRVETAISKAKELIALMRQIGVLSDATASSAATAARTSFSDT
jgi:hypothetical protein